MSLTGYVYAEIPVSIRIEFIERCKTDEIADNYNYGNLQLQKVINSIPVSVNIFTSIGDEDYPRLRELPLSSSNFVITIYLIYEIESYNDMINEIIPNIKHYSNEKTKWFVFGIINQYNYSRKAMKNKTCRFLSVDEIVTNHYIKDNKHIELLIHGYFRQMESKHHIGLNCNDIVNLCATFFRIKRPISFEDASTLTKQLGASGYFEIDIKKDKVEVLNIFTEMLTTTISQDKNKGKRCIVL
eukprot:87964_1